MKRIFGIETEYGITVDGVEQVDVVEESIAIVRSYTEHGASMKWNYRLEDPHCDARGFHAAELRQDTDEASYMELDRSRPLTFEEIKSDLVLSNGARFYNDHAHPEYSTPECSTLRELLVHDKAGERILWECARRRNSRLRDGRQVRLYKNNTDFIGHSFGCHDNYLMSREVPWEQIVMAMVPFLVTRQIFAGAGKLGIEKEGSVLRPGVFQISQRSDFFSVLVSIDTMNRRPIINTRDEPHADARRYRRFHCIVGDANLSEVATALKVGTTALVLELLERGHAPQLELENPIEATRSISRDPSWEWPVKLSDGKTLSAIEIQRLYLEAARDYCDVTDPETAWVLGEWESVLNDLQVDPMRCSDRLDWVAKRLLLEAFRESENLEWDDPWLQSIDLEYHNIDPDAGLYHGLANACSMRTLVTEEEIDAAIFQPPVSTRAFFRGRAVARFASQIASLQWDEVVFRTAAGLQPVALAEAFDDGTLGQLNERIQSARTVEGLFADEAADQASWSRGSFSSSSPSVDQPP